jgi:hypothetical protein
MNPYHQPISTAETRPGGFGVPDEARVLRALALLGRGKDQWAVVNDLRAQGLSLEEAKRESAAVFDEAVIRLRHAQRLKRLLAWLLIASGPLLPLGLAYAGFGFVIFSLAPVVFGIALLYKLPRPRRIPPALLQI